MREMATALWFILFVVLGVGNNVIAEDKNPSAVQDSATVPSTQAFHNTSIFSAEETSVATESEGAKEATTASSDVATPEVDGIASPDPAPGTTTEAVTSHASVKPISLSLESSVEGDQTESEQTEDLSPPSETDADFIAPSSEKPSGSTLAEEKEPTQENTKLEPLAPSDDAIETQNTSSEDIDESGPVTEMQILNQENVKLPLPTGRSLVLNEDEERISSAKSGTELENNKSKLVSNDSSDSEMKTSTSESAKTNVTEMQILTEELIKLAPPMMESLVETGKSILGNNDSSERDNEQTSVTSAEDLSPTFTNLTSTTRKPSTKGVKEKCPTDSPLPCVVKCCPYKQSLVGDKCRPSLVRFIPQFTLLVNGFNDTKPENETDKMAKYNLIEQNICVGNRYRLEPSVESVDEFHLLVNGSIWLPATKPQHTMLASDQYCMEVFNISGEEVMLPLVCLPDSSGIVESSFHFMVYPIGLLISVPFLLATFIVYNMIPELRNLHGKSLSCYVLCLMMAYIFLAVVQLGGQGFDTNVCVGVAFAIQFSFIACFFWLNVLCFDTWRNVFVHGDLGYTMEKSQERSFFIFYSIYAWSFTIVLIIVTMVMNFTPTIPSSYLKPGIGEKTCWFNTEREAFPYFYGPVGVLIIINVILFIMTAIKLILEHHKQDDERTKRTPTQTFQLCLTLFFIMGINWVMEIISWAAGGPPFIWYITDICNTLQGIFIFVVFVMDERVRGLCRTELFPRLQEFFAACCPQRRPRRTSNEPQYDSINGQEMVYMFKKEDVEP